MQRTANGLAELEIEEQWDHDRRTSDDEGSIQQESKSCSPCSRPRGLIGWRPLVLGSCKPREAAGGVSCVDWQAQGGRSWGKRGA